LKPLSCSLLECNTTSGAMRKEQRQRGPSRAQRSWGGARGLLKEQRQSLPAATCAFTEKVNLKDSGKTLIHCYGFRSQSLPNIRDTRNQWQIRGDLPKLDEVGEVQEVFDASYLRKVLPHSHTHTLSHSHTLTLSHSHTLTLSHSHTLTLSHSHTLTRILSPKSPAERFL